MDVGCRHTLACLVDAEVPAGSTVTHRARAATTQTFLWVRAIDNGCHSSTVVRSPHLGRSGIEAERTDAARYVARPCQLWAPYGKQSSTA